jgi:hypothetical protein
MKRYLKISVYALIPILLFLVPLLVDNYYFKNNQIKITYPWQNSLFPADYAAPIFIWADKNVATKNWKVNIYNNIGGVLISKSTDTCRWEPSVSEWENIKKKSDFKPLKIVVSREISDKSLLFKFRAIKEICISKDSVNASILYRELPLPFAVAELNARLMSYTLLNVADTSEPKVILDNFLVCGNCHSFSGDGKKIALDFDASQRDKGGYFIADIDSQAVFSKSNYMSWSKMIGKSTFGLLSKISRDGKFVVTTTKDRAVLEKFNDKRQLAYSQFFLPVNGVLTVYNIETKELNELPGANDMDYVQTNAIWTPDGKNLIFARAKAIPYDTDIHVSDKVDTNIIRQFVNRTRDFKFDLYIIPFNGGKGGEAKPIPGASNNGKSNYFPAISPDGKWLIFCQADNFMMLQPDSKLFITNLETGKTRVLESNFNSMNSWHSWSPNGKWVTFVSKVLGPYTKLYLTHIDENGHASVPILVQKAWKSLRAVNYPEFVNRNVHQPFKMDYNYVEIYHIQKALEDEKYTKVDSLLKIFLAQGQYSLPSEYYDLADIMYSLGRDEEARKFEEKGYALDKQFYKSLVSDKK